MCVFLALFSSCAPACYTLDPSCLNEEYHGIMVHPNMFYPNSWLGLKLQSRFMSHNVTLAAVCIGSLWFL